MNVISQSVQEIQDFESASYFEEIDVKVRAGSETDISNALRRRPLLEFWVMNPCIALKI
jgi:hypothetical protein